ncbi:MAG: hydroxyacylglutathione hydrolase [Candidatus Symbiodolus clandestinus]
MTKLLSIPALKDNYIWLLQLPQQRAIIIDPGDAVPVLHYLAQQPLTPIAILLTHHHADHTAGVSALKAAHPQMMVYGPEETVDQGITQLIRAGLSLTIGELPVQILAVPGHTLGHVAYYFSSTPQTPWLFCGDTLFSAGCGRLFEGTAEQLFGSLQQLAALPSNTRICCAHEYTLDNLRFARQVDPLNPYLPRYQQHIIRLRGQMRPSLPTSLATQLLINPFLRCQQPDLQQQLGMTSSPSAPLNLFTELRHRKDHFK